jgi:transglutaminase-like putative cysteine protease
MKKLLAVFFFVAVAFVAGVFFGRQEEEYTAQFHDMRVIGAEDYVRLVDPHSPEVVALAKRLGSIERAYEYVRDEIAFQPRLSAASPKETLAAKAGSCLGKAALLCSVLRAMEHPASSVRVVVGHVTHQESIVEHAWVELENKGTCVQADPTDMFGRFPFNKFTGTQYTDAFVWKENFCFNDEGFALISQLNRYRNGPPPWMRERVE